MAESLPCQRCRRLPACLATRWPSPCPHRCSCWHAMFCTAVLASVATFTGGDPLLVHGWRSAAADVAWPAAGVAARGAVPAESAGWRRPTGACLAAASAAVGGGRGLVDPAAGTGAGVTGAGVFHGSSTGWEAFHAATPAATAAAMTPKIRRPRCLGFCWLGQLACRPLAWPAPLAAALMAGHRPSVPAPGRRG